MKAQAIRIVPMQPCHLDALAELEQLCFSQPWSKEGLEAELSEPTACFAVAEENERAIGYAGMHCVLDEAYIANVAVHPNHRRKGVGLLLMQALSSAAQKRGAAFLSLEVRASNASALALYQTCGFQTAGVRKGLYEQPKEDGLVLTKPFG